MVQDQNLVCVARGARGTKDPGLGGDTRPTTYPRNDVHEATETMTADNREESIAHLALRHQNEDGTTLEKTNGALATTATPIANLLPQTPALGHLRLPHHPLHAPKPLYPPKKPPATKNPLLPP